MTVNPATDDHAKSGTSASSPTTCQPSDGGRKPVPDPVDEAAEESFPASDPPTFSGSTATPTEPGGSTREIVEEARKHPK